MTVGMFSFEMPWVNICIAATATTQHSDWYSFSQFYCYCWSLSIKTRSYILFLHDDHDLTHIPFSFPSNCEYSCSQTFKKAERMYFHKHFPSRETQDDKDDVAESCLFLFNFPVCLMPLLMLENAILLETRKKFRKVIKCLKSMLSAPSSCKNGNYVYPQKTFFWTR